MTYRRDYNKCLVGCNPIARSMWWQPQGRYYKPEETILTGPSERG